MKSLRAKTLVVISIVLSMSAWCNGIGISAEIINKKSVSVKKMATEQATAASVPVTPLTKHKPTGKKKDHIRNGSVEKAENSRAEPGKKSGAHVSSRTEVKEIPADTKILPQGPVNLRERKNGFCNSKTRTVGNISKEKCTRLGGDFFMKRSAAHVDLVQKKRELTRTVMGKRTTRHEIQRKDVLPSQRVAATGPLFSGHNRHVAGDLKLPEVGSDLRDPSRGPRDFGEMRPDWQQPPKAPLPDGVNTGLLDRGPTQGDYPDWITHGPAGGENDPATEAAARIKREIDNSDAPLDTPEERERQRHREQEEAAEQELEEFLDDVNDALEDAAETVADTASDLVELVESVIDSLLPEDSDDPEGGDNPEELEALAFAGQQAARLGADSEGGNRSGRTGFTIPGEQPGDDGWARHRMEIQGKGGVDPEGVGGPDESVDQSEISVQLVRQSAAVAGSASSPPDGGQGNPDNPRPPRPEESDAYVDLVQAAAASETQVAMTSSELAASPPDGGQGDPDNPTPPRPEMVERPDGSDN